MRVIPEIKFNPVNRRRWERFVANRRGFWSLWLFLLLFTVSLGAEFIVNDRPLLIAYQGELFCPVLVSYAETDFGGEFATEADYRDPYLVDLIEQNDGLIVWPLVRYHYDTINYELKVPAPSPPSSANWLGTDDQGRDVVARLIYGFRISILFGLCLTFFGSLVGVAAGAVQGYYGGRVDLFGQRFMEIWSGLPVLYLLIILSSFVQPNFWWLLGIMLLFSWMSLVGVVRAEFLRGRNLDYVRAAQALGAGDLTVMFAISCPMR